MSTAPDKTTANPQPAGSLALTPCSAGSRFVDSAATLREAEAFCEDVDMVDEDDRIHEEHMCLALWDELRNLRIALRFYADPHNYGVGGGSSEKIYADAGRQARAALRMPNNAICSTQLSHNAQTPA